MCHRGGVQLSREKNDGLASSSTRGMYKASLPLDWREFIRGGLKRRVELSDRVVNGKGKNAKYSWVLVGGWTGQPGLTAAYSAASGFYPACLSSIVFLSISIRPCWFMPCRSLWVLLCCWYRGHARRKQQSEKILNTTEMFSVFVKVHGFVSVVGSLS